MHQIVPKEYPQLRALDGLSARSMDRHYKLYEGYVAKVNELTKRMESLRASQGLAGDLQSLKTDLTFAWGAVKNHELFFASLGPSQETPGSELAEALTRDFGGVPQFLVDFRQTALSSRSWCWTAYDLDEGFLLNYRGAHANGLPVWNAVPLLGVDLYGHAYLYDFGASRGAYLDAVLRNLNWRSMDERFAAARQLTNASQSF